MTRLQYLMERYRTNRCTREEVEELFGLIREGNENELFQILQQQWDEVAKRMDVPGVVATPKRRLRTRRQRIAVLLCLLLVVGGAGVIYRMSSVAKITPPHILASPPRFKNDVQPGGDKAILTLADGTTIVLDSSRNGSLSTQGNARVIKLSNGRLAYQAMKGGAEAGPVYNTISTPRGGQYQIELPDGSKVWLDASSTLRFPTAFTGKTRDVQLSGEAYFDVTGNPNQPFFVSVFSQEPGRGDELQRVQVLGTQFNVMDYADERFVKTTLLEGSVKVQDAGRESMIRPGEEAQLTRDHTAGIQVIHDADVDAAMAWKNGYFNFNKADIQTIMRQLSRWYDIDVSFRGGAGGDRVFYGGIQRNLPLTSVFRILERSGVQFSIEGKKVVVDL